MFLIIEDNYKILKNNINNHFVYKGNEIVLKQNEYYLYLKNNYYINGYSDEIKLEYKKYEIVNKRDLQYFNLYVYKDDKGIDEYSIYANNSFIIANHSNANIQIYNPFGREYYLYYKDGYLKSNYQCLSYNSHKYNNEIIKDGDYVDYFGVHIIFYNQFLYINNFNIHIYLDKKELIEKKIKLKEKEIELKNYYEQKPIELSFKKLKTIDLPKKASTRNIIFQIGPSITISLGMLSIALINSANSYSGQINISSILMPIIMLISSFLWPILIKISDARKFKKEYSCIKNEYLEYLKEYEKEVILKINNYLKYQKQYYFNQINIFDKLFYISHHSDNFLTISIGKYIKSIQFEEYETKDLDINEIIGRIKYHLNNIEDYPLYLDLKENKKITIITKADNQEYLFKRTLLELVYKYHPDDLKIVIYTKDLNLIYEVNNIPHLFDKNCRQTFLDEQDLYLINKMEYHHKVIVLADEMLDFEIDNPSVIVIYFSNNERDLIKNSDVMINYLEDTGVYKDKNNTISFKYAIEDINFDDYFKYITNYTKYDLVKKNYSFKDIFLSICVVENYKLRQESLVANFAVYEDKILDFDLHESKDGPHGLIGGSTGSGKSEVIVSMLLSLAIRYRPDYLNIILIDYKGGGIKESLSSGGKCIPHIIASVDNLNTDTFERLIIAIAKKCKERQKLFKELSKLSGLSIVNIDDYLNNYRAYSLPAIAHLLIVVDEFAELKKENPEIIKELISFSRIGRSLGLHLLLATQKPGGVIDEEIWSNSRFKIALKVQSEKDSLDIIKTKDSAYLNKPGEFYLKIDNKLIKAISIYSKQDISSNNAKEVVLLNNKLEVKRCKLVKSNTQLIEASYLSREIIEAVNLLNIKTNELIFDKARALTINELASKYNIYNELLFGEIDDYFNAKRDILSYGLNEDILICSYRDNEIANILNQFNDLNMDHVIISNKKYTGKNILACALYDNQEDINYLLNKLLNHSMHNLYLIIEDYPTLVSYNEEYNNMLNKIVKRSSINNIHVILLSKQSNIAFKLINSFKHKLIIGSKDSQDQLNIYAMKSNYHGDSFFFNERLIPFIPCLINDYQNKEEAVIDYLDRIPEIIKYESDNQNILIGYDLLKRNKIYINAKETLLITGLEEKKLIKFKNIYQKCKHINIQVYEHALVKDKYDNILWVKNGINMQRLFYIDKHEDFNGYYLYRNNKGREIRPVNHE